MCSNEEDVPDAPVVRASVRDLALWGKIGVAERPTIEQAITWLRNLPSGQRLREDDFRCIRGLLRRHGARVWNDCGYWLNLAREWVPVTSLRFAIGMQSLGKWSH